jgi:hypothetical protein
MRTAPRCAPAKLRPVRSNEAILLRAKDFFLCQRYDNYDRVFTAMNIQFHKLTEPGEAMTL